MIVYAARNFMTGKVYIGSTIQPFQTRIWKHESKAKAGIKRPMYIDMRALGPESFIWKKLIDCESKKQMLAYEAEIIDLLETHKNGYNIAIDGGCNRGGKSSAETRVKLAEGQRRSWLGDRKIPVKRGPWKAITEKNKTSIVALRKEGKSFTQIGKIFGANQSTIFYAIKRWTT